MNDSLCTICPAFRDNQERNDEMKEKMELNLHNILPDSEMSPAIKCFPSRDFETLKPQLPRATEDAL